MFESYGTQILKELSLDLLNNSNLDTMFTDKGYTKPNIVVGLDNRKPPSVKDKPYIVFYECDYILDDNAIAYPFVLSASVGLYNKEYTDVVEDAAQNINQQKGRLDSIDLAEYIGITIGEYLQNNFKAKYSLGFEDIVNEYPIFVRFIQVSFLIKKSYRSPIQQQRIKG